MSNETELTKEQCIEKVNSMYEQVCRYRKRAEDLFNGKRDEAAAEMNDILAKNMKAMPLMPITNDHTFVRAPDGNLYLVEAKNAN